MSAGPAAARGPGVSGGAATVATITRTKNRARMLERAAEHLLAQTFSDFTWIIVNDGGDPLPVEAVARRYEGSGRRVSVHHLSQGLGMEAAANLGIRLSESNYLHIHDDDDTLHPGFYETTVRHLESSGSMGVTTNIEEVHEVVANGRIEGKLIRQWETGYPSLARMISINRFVPISFLYRREVHERIGDYNEALKACGDWEFYLRFLRHFDIDKIQGFLARYHIRDATDDEAAINSVNKLADHSSADGQIRNGLVRRELDAGTLGYGALITLGGELWELEARLREIELKGREAFELKDRIMERLRRNPLLRWIVR